ncbi:MAG: FAD-dependent oxidoreductase, partial [Bacteroidales bacterium]|nr:FAD-dependent oxidoreductase [Bacteroidales bacterium]
MDRRKFIGTSGLVAAAGVAAPLLSSCRGSSDPSLAGAKATAKESYKCDLLVIGGGPSGVCAAISAARLGAKVMLVDSGNCLGGMGTKGLVGPFMTCYDA